MLEKIDQARKAVAAFIVPALVVLVAALNDGSDGGSEVTTGEWLTALIAALAASGSVYALRNGASTDPALSTPDAPVGRHAREGDAGLSTVATAALVALVVVLVVLFVLPRL